MAKVINTLLTTGSRLRDFLFPLRFYKIENKKTLKTDKISLYMIIPFCSIDIFYAEYQRLKIRQNVKNLKLMFGGEEWL